MDENAIIRQLTEIDSRSKSNTHRLDRLEKLADSVNNLAQSVALMAATCEDVKAIKDAPADSWRELKKGLLVALAGVLVGFLSAKLGF